MIPSRPRDMQKLTALDLIINNTIIKNLLKWISIYLKCVGTKSTIAPIIMEIESPGKRM